MKVVGSLPAFPAKQPVLRGTNLEAFQLLKTSDKAKPVLKVDPEGQSVAAGKRAFARAAKELGGTARTLNADDGTILVRLDVGAGRPARTRAKVHPEHSTAAIEAEMKQLYPNY